jgi:hypothetical protein
MSRRPPILISVVFALFLLSAGDTAADQRNLLILPESPAPDAVARDNQLFTRVIGAISKELQNQGFRVFDETAVNLGNLAHGRVRRNDAELIDIAGSVPQPPINILVLVSIFVDVSRLAYTTRINIRMTGRLLSVASGQRLGNFEVSEPNVQAPLECDRNCLLNFAGNASRGLSHNLGAALGARLAARSKSSDGKNATNLGNGFTLSFQGFDEKEMEMIEDFLVAFDGYQSHGAISTTARTNELWYQSSSSSTHLSRNLGRMLDHISAKGQVTFSGSTFRVRKTSDLGPGYKP